MIPVKASSFGRFTGAVRRYPGGTENAIILATLVARDLEISRPRASRWAHPSAQASFATLRYKSTVKILPPSLLARKGKVADYYAARSRLIPPLPWQTFAPPFSTSLVSQFVTGARDST